MHENVTYGPSHISVRDHRPWWQVPYLDFLEIDKNTLNSLECDWLGNITDKIFPVNNPLGLSSILFVYVHVLQHLTFPFHISSQG